MLLEGMGNLSIALKKLQCTDHLTTSNTQKAYLASTRQRLLSFSGKRQLNPQDIIVDYNSMEWLLHCASLITKAASIPRLSKKNILQQQKLYSQVIEICSNVNPVNQGHLLSSWRLAWFKAHAFNKQGKSSLALETLTRYRQSAQLSFQAQMLISALLLEISLNINHPDLLPFVFEAELRKIFDRAESEKLASCQGLRELLFHWNPLAYAYLSFVPNPLKGFDNASQLILRVGHSNSIYDFELPPMFACELVLRSLDFDIRKGAYFIASDPGSSRKQRLKLLTEYGDTIYWRPALSIIPILVGLFKSKDISYLKQAQKIYNEYGVYPITQGSYVMIPTVEKINELTKQLLNKTFNVNEFCTELINLA